MSDSVDSPADPAKARHADCITLLAIREVVMEVLQLDVSGRPQAWISAREAAMHLCQRRRRLDARATPSTCCAAACSAAPALQSRIEVHPIIAVRGAVPSRAWRQAPALTNTKLFARDRLVCAYCGGHFHADDLTREHIVPVSRGGARHLDELHHRLPRLQRPQGQPAARGGADDAAVPALRAEPARGHDPARPAHPVATRWSSCSPACRAAAACTPDRLSPTQRHAKSIPCGFRIG